MSTKILLQKATRIEGNADIHIEIENGTIKTARFMVQDFRGFEKIVFGKQVASVPHIVSRICGLCCTAHQVAGFRAIEDALGIDVPPPVKHLRTIAVLGELIASHALSYFFLSMPDIMKGVSRGIFDLMKQYPEIAKDAFALRKAGNRILEIIGRRPVHSVAMGIASFNVSYTQKDLDEISIIATQVRDISRRLISNKDKRFVKEKHVPFPDGKINFLTFDRAYEDEPFRIYNRSGETIESFSIDTFNDHISEMRVDWSFAKFPYLTSQGFPQGILLVGPISRIFRKESILTDPELAEFEMARYLIEAKQLFLDDFDICRLLEIFSTAKRILKLLKQIDLSQMAPDDFSLDKSGYGIGVVEAPRGILVHNYTVKRGVMERMRLLVATQINNAFINMVLKDLAEHHIENNGISAKGEELLSRSIRIFDPCLTCATH